MHQVDVSPLGLPPPTLCVSPACSSPRTRVSNAMAEAKNARIQRIKNMACGFRNRERFRMAILFHLGGLNLMPKTLSNFAT